MEEAGLLGHAPPWQNYSTLCCPPPHPIFGAPWQYREEMHLMQLQYNNPPVHPFGMQCLTAKKKRGRRKRNTKRTTWMGDESYHKDLGIQIKLGKNSQTTINIEMIPQQQSNIVVKNTSNRNRIHFSEQNRHQNQKIRIQRQSTSVNVRLEPHIPNRPKLNATLRRNNRSIQQRLRRRRSVEGGSRGCCAPFKTGISPLLRDEDLNTTKTWFNKQNSPRKFYNRRKNFRNRQNKGEIGEQHRGIQESVVVTEVDEEEIEGGFIPNRCRRANSFFLDGSLESQALISANIEEM